MICLVKNCANNLCGTGSRVSQPTSKTALKHKSLSNVTFRLENNVPSNVREASDLKNLFVKLNGLSWAWKCVTTMYGLVRFFRL